MVYLARPGRSLAVGCSFAVRSCFRCEEELKKRGASYRAELRSRKRKAGYIWTNTACWSDSTCLFWHGPRWSAVVGSRAAAAQAHCSDATKTKTTTWVPISERNIEVPIEDVSVDAEENRVLPSRRLALAPIYGNRKNTATCTSFGAKVRCKYSRQ
jgi:hypothetical protein